MPARRQAPKGKKSTIVITNENQSSQGVDGDRAIMAEVAQKLNASLNNKKKAQEKQLILSIKKDINHALTPTISDIRCTTNSMNERYTKFTLDYAAAEDSIRNLWVQVCTEHNRILMMQELNDKKNKDFSVETERAFLQGLARTKGACEEISEIIRSLDLRD